jgi:hypothetical protein
MPIGSGIMEGAPGDLIEMDFAFLRYDDALQSAVSIATATGRPRMVNSLGGGAIHYPYVPLTLGSHIRARGGGGPRQCGRGS